MAEAEPPSKVSELSKIIGWINQNGGRKEPVTTNSADITLRT